MFCLTDLISLSVSLKDPLKDAVALSRMIAHTYDTVVVLFVQFNYDEGISLQIYITI